MLAKNKFRINLNWNMDRLGKRILDFKVGIIPLIIYMPLLIIIYLLIADEKLPADMLGAIPVMGVFGFALAEVGKRVPILKDIGGASILATFLPSYLVAKHFIPDQAVTAVTTFMKSTNFLYVFISMIVLGSILGMSRQVLVRAFSKMFIPLLLASIAGVGVGVAAGSFLGIGAFKTLFFIVVPIMAGGVGEGAIPLSMAYAAILDMKQEEVFAQILPAVMLGSLSAIILAGLLKRLGDMKPEYTGNGSLVKGGDDIGNQAIQEEKPINLAQMGAGAFTAIGFYLFGVYVSSLIGIPGPIIMLFSAAGLKALGWLPKEIENGAHMIYRFFVVAVTFPLLFAVGVTMTPWDSIISVLKPAYLITIFLTVLTMVVVGFFAGKWMNLHPVETAIVTACHSGQGGTGDLAILTASDRLVLMPFAQVSTRIGGACMVTLATLLLRWFER